MAKLVVLDLGIGTLETGFLSVKVNILADGNRLVATGSGQLPSSLGIANLYDQWQFMYSSLGFDFRAPVEGIEIEEVGTTNFSERDFNDLDRELKQEINAWFNSMQFRPIYDRLRTQLNPSEEVRLVLAVDDPKIQTLPWHLWQFFEDYPKAEVALSARESSQASLTKHSKDKVRILAILGNSKGINVEVDRLILEALPHAETVFLVKPERQELNGLLWDSPGWDILCFSGHSSSQDAMGRIYINETDSLTIPQLKNALKEAIKRGLQLAIFNSCDGLGLARELANLHIPQIIVMRKPVPDKVAQEFLKDFLSAFSRGESFYLSVREAREKLQGMESEFPCATWLPIICQNPTEVPPTWQELYRSSDRIDPSMQSTLAGSHGVAEHPTILVSRYEIVKHLGGGGFGQTFLARDNHLPGKPLCVVKQLNPKYRDAETLKVAKRLFAQEADILYSLGDRHGQIPHLMAHFEQDGEFYLVEEFIEGRSLDTEITPGKQWNEAETIALLYDVLEVLSFVHQQSVIHRDIKPANLIRRKQDNKIVLIDFGAVKQVRCLAPNTNGESNLTVAVGSPGYMSNEQVVGQPHFSSDLYALGMLCIQALTGLAPGDLLRDPDTNEYNCAALDSSKHPAAKSISIQPELAAFLNKMVRYDYRKRFENATEALQTLQKLLGSSEAKCFQEATLLLHKPKNMTGDVAISVTAESAVTSNQSQHFQPRIFRRLFQLRTVLITSMAIACSIMGVRYFGLIQPLELAAFDRMMRSRPAEKQDSRLLVVTVDEESLKYQDEQNMPRQGSLSNRALIPLLAKLKQHGARTIGLDIYRDAPPLKADMSELLKQYGDRHLIVVCKVGEPDGSNAVAPPKGSSVDSHSFSDIVKDDDGVVRRQLLQMGTIPNSLCTTEYSLGLQLAARYLLDIQGIAPQSTPENHLQFGNIVFPRLSNHTSGYQQIDERGYQLLLNYRSPYNQEQIAQTVTLKQVLTGQVNPESVKDRIVLIGVTDPSFRDYVRTPYSEGQPADRSEMSGVMLQAQMASHILSAVLDRRPLIWVWATWAEFLWVCGWAVVGGALVWCLHRRPLHLILSSGASVLFLYGTCFVIFLQAGWIPFVPSTLALISTGGVVWVWTRKLEIKG